MSFCHSVSFQVKTFLVLSILSTCLLALPMTIIVSIGLDEDERDYDRACEYDYHYKSCSDVSNCEDLMYGSLMLF